MGSKSILLVAVLFLSAVSFAGTYSGGSGSEALPYLIGDSGDWQELMTTSGDWGSSFILTADVNLAGVNLTPLGNDGTRFTGVFDGNDNIISNAVINQPGSNYIGLFGYVGSGGQIRNLGIENANITVTGTAYCVGGLVGVIESGTLTSCYMTGSVSGYYYVGGLVGSNSGTLTSCYATGSVSGTASQVGGRVGINSGSLTGCYATGSVSGNGKMGGLVGVIESGGTLTSCYATGSVSGGGSGGTFGGLVGSIASGGTLTSCYATGSVSSGSGSVGGLVGNYAGLAFYCFWDTQTSGQLTSSGGGVGYHTAIMQDSEIYLRAFWDFKGEIKNGINDTWAMPQGGGYPVLAWQLEDSPVSNDEMNNAIAVTVGLVVLDTSIGASGLDVTHNGYKDNIDVWYIFTAPSNDDYVIGTLGSNFDTTLAVFDEDSIEIEFNDNYNCKQSKLTLRAIAGVEYFIRIAGYDSEQGDYTLLVTEYEASTSLEDQVQELNEQITALQQMVVENRLAMEQFNPLKKLLEELGSSQSILGDINHDGKVDAADLEIITSNWLKEVP